MKEDGSEERGERRRRTEDTRGDATPDIDIIITYGAGS